MGRAVIIDACTLGLLCHPVKKECRKWADSLVDGGCLIKIPEIADYEVRRELMRAEKVDGLKQLDAVVEVFGTLPTCRDTLLNAAALWAQIRTLLGQQGCDNKRLDADVIIAAQAKLLSIAQSVTVKIATDNVRHFLAFVDGTHIVDALPWGDIHP